MAARIRAVVGTGSGYILKIELRGFADSLDVRLEKELSRATGKMEWSFPELGGLGKTINGRENQELCSGHVALEMLIRRSSGDDSGWLDL